MVKKGTPGQLPMEFLVPATQWKVPTELPDLVSQGVRVASQDLETRDDGIAAGRGAGWATGAGYICGVAVGWEGGTVYVPVRHPDTTNFPRENVIRWLRDMDRGGIRWVFHNGGYDLGWRRTDFGLDPPEYLEDTHAAAVMLDENRLTYRLDALCRAYGLPGKDKRALIEAGRAYGYGQTEREVMSNLWRLPARFVGEYAEGDAVATLSLWTRLQPALEAQDLVDAYRLEMDLIPLCMEMRRRGIRIDTARADSARAELRSARDAALAQVGAIYREGRAVEIGDVMSPVWLERAFTSEGISFPRTEKTRKGSFQSDWLEKNAHPLPQAVARARYYQMIEDKFIRGFLLDYCHRGRVHAEINQLRDDDGGTRSYRFSYSDPPLQQMPSPKRGSAVTKAAGRLIRSCFLPEEGERWAKADWSQQEQRLMVHYAEIMGLPRAQEAAERYRSDRSTDFHSMVAEMTGLPRPEAKDCNFAKAYGAGVAKFALMSGRSQAEAKRIMEKYDEELPFTKMLSEECRRTADRRGYVRLIDGARCRFDLWEPGWGYEGPYIPPCDRATAERRAEQGSGHDWEGARLRRAFTHKALNRLIQGSAARQCKLAMRTMWQEGIVPLLQLHDEVDVSFSDSRIPERVQEIMENAVDVRVPMVADVDIGDIWGEAG